MKNKHYKVEAMELKNTQPKIEFWIGDGETYYAEWNSVRQGYKGGCVDIRRKGSSGGHCFFMHAVPAQGPNEFDVIKIVPAFNWKDGTPSLEILEAYLENSTVYELAKYKHDIFHFLIKAVVRD